MKGQASVEYLIVVGVAFLVMIPAIFFFFNFSKETGQDISLSQLDAVGREMVQAAETLYYGGVGSKTTMEISIPLGVNHAFIADQRELVFNASTNAGELELVFFSRVNLTTSGGCSLGQCDIAELGVPGAKQVRLTALDNAVRIEQVG
jgi:hypothetical protein